MQKVQSLELLQVTRRFGATTALHELSLNIPGGAFVSLLGPSGCGKSTALNCIAGLSDLSSGQILMNGQRIDHLPPERRRFGMVFQSYALFPHMSVQKNVAFGLEIRGLKRAEIDERVLAALRMMRLEDYAKRLPGELSGGQQQRLAFARTVVLEPRLLLLDEPLSNLDAKLRDDLRLEIKRLHDRLGITTIHVTHDQTEAMSLSDLVVVLRQGRLEQAGTPEEIYQKPASLFVADFMGYRNRLSVDVTEADGHGVRLQAQGIDLLATGQFGLRQGAKAVVCFRPDDATLGSDQDASPARNHFDARVELSEYLGRSYAAEAALRCGTILHVQNATPLLKGDTIRISLRPERLMVYAAE